MQTTRRELLQQLACGFGSVALSSLLADEAWLTEWQSCYRTLLSRNEFLCVD